MTKHLDMINHELNGSMIDISTSRFKEVVELPLKVLQSFVQGFSPKINYCIQ
jgi:hypothetical protein